MCVDFGIPLRATVMRKILSKSLAICYESPFAARPDVCLRDAGRFLCGGLGVFATDGKASQPEKLAVTGGI